MRNIPLVVAMIALCVALTAVASLAVDKLPLRIYINGSDEWVPLDRRINTYPAPGTTVLVSAEKDGYRWVQEATFHFDGSGFVPPLGSGPNWSKHLTAWRSMPSPYQTPTAK